MPPRRKKNTLLGIRWHPIPWRNGQFGLQWRHSLLFPKVGIGGFVCGKNPDVFADYLSGSSHPPPSPPWWRASKSTTIKYLLVRFPRVGNTFRVRVIQLKTSQPRTRLFHRNSLTTTPTTTPTTKNPPKHDASYIHPQEPSLYQTPSHHLPTFFPFAPKEWFSKSASPASANATPPSTT